jgi:hypothetical protein
MRHAVCLSLAADKRLHIIDVESALVVQTYVFSSLLQSCRWNLDGRYLSVLGKDILYVLEFSLSQSVKATSNTSRWSDINDSSKLKTSERGGTTRGRRHGLTLVASLPCNSNSTIRDNCMMWNNCNQLAFIGDDSNPWVYDAINGSVHNLLKARNVRKDRRSDSFSGDTDGHDNDMNVEKDQYAPSYRSADYSQYYRPGTACCLSWSPDVVVPTLAVGSIDRTVTLWSLK